MADDFVQAPADGVGKKLQTFSNVVGANTVHAEAMTPVDSTGTELALATEATLGTVHGHVDSIDGKITACNTGAIAGIVSTKTALTAAAPTATSVGVASAQAVAANANRKSLVLINTSTATISIAFGAAPAVLSSGITLNAGGGVYEMDEYLFTTAVVNAIASAAASNLAVQEYT
jgi:hypothetical protein